jgi:hypothetical protein
MRIRAPLLLPLILSAMCAAQKSTPLPLLVLTSTSWPESNWPESDSTTRMVTTRFPDKFVDSAQHVGGYSSEPSTKRLPLVYEIRLYLMCNSKHPGCLALEVGKTYLVRPLHPGESGYTYSSKSCGDLSVDRHGRHHNSCTWEVDGWPMTVAVSVEGKETGVYLMGVQGYVGPND